MVSQENEYQSGKTGIITLVAVFIALTFVFTLICVPGPRGGFVHFGNIPAFTAAVLLGKKFGWLPGTVGMALYDLAGGFFMWAPFTFVIRLIMGLVLSAVTSRSGGTSAKSNAAGMLIASAVMIAGYYIAEVVIYGNPYTPVTSIPGNAVQLAIGIAGSLILIPILQKIRIPGSGR